MIIKSYLAVGALLTAAIAGAARSQSGAKPTLPPTAKSADAGASYPVFFTKTCSQCHDYSVATTQRHSPQEWSDIIDKMVDLGLTAPDDRLSQVKAYLSETFPKK